MKKILSILASLTIITSSAAGVIACGTTTETKDGSKKTVENNSEENLLGSAFNEAKAIIIDDHYKISPKIANDAFKTLRAKDLITDYQTEGSLTTDSDLQAVIHQYFGEQESYTPKDVAEKISINNTKGILSGLDSLILNSGILKDQNAKDNAMLLKKGLIDTLNTWWKGGRLNGSFVVNILDTIYRQDTTSNNATSRAIDGFINELNSRVKMKELAPQIHKLIEKTIAPGISGLLADEKGFKTLREFGQTYLADGSSENLKDNLYKTDDAERTALASIKVSDVKKEIILSIYRLLKVIFVFPDHSQDLYKDLTNPLDQASLAFADLITMAIDKKPLQKNADWKSQPSLNKITLEILRIVTIMNAYFSLFEQSKSFTPTDSQHLFGANQSNFAYLNSMFSKTLGDTQYIKDQALNLNYFIANLDYYFGSLRLQDDLGAFRFQQGLFLMLADATDADETVVTEKNESRNYRVRQSDVTSVLVNTALLVGSQKNNNSPTNIFWIIYNSASKSQIQTLARTITLGFANGEDMHDIQQLIIGILTMLQGSGNGILAFLKPYFEDLELIFKNGMKKPEFTKNTLHLLLTGNLRELLTGTTMIKEELFNRWFGIDQKINIQTFVAKPLIDIISIFVPRAYENSLGEMFYNDSVVDLFHILNLYVNRFNPDFNPELGVYENAAHPEEAFRALNLDLNTVNQLISELLGDEKGENNVFSRALLALGQPDETKNGFMERLGFNLKAFLEAFGMNGESSFKKDQTAGILVGWLLPLLKVKDDKSDSWKITKDDYKIDLLGGWTTNMADILVKLDGIYPHYREEVTNLVQNTNVFKLHSDDVEFTYFDPKVRTQLKGVTFRIDLNNPITGKLVETYQFNVAREKANDEHYKFASVTSEPKEETTKKGQTK